MLTKSLTIVLPIYNGESRLRTSVREILELAGELTSQFGILIVDDGSTDSTYEVAEELAAHYPQISVRRHRHRRGLGPTLDYVQRSVRSDAVMVHDGVAPIDPNQMRNEWRRWVAQASCSNDATVSAALQVDICDFANLPAIHAAMEHAHARMVGFQLVSPLLANNTPSDDRQGTSQPVPRADASHVHHHFGVGQIPRLPRPKFLSALARFAWGE